MLFLFFSTSQTLIWNLQSLEVKLVILEILVIYLLMDLNLNPYQGNEDLYRPHGHKHWTEFAHKIIGEKIGQMILENYEKLIKKY